MSLQPKFPCKMSAVFTVESVLLTMRHYMFKCTYLVHKTNHKSTDKSIPLTAQGRELKQMANYLEKEID